MPYWDRHLVGDTLGRTSTSALFVVSGVIKLRYDLTLCDVFREVKLRGRSFRGLIRLSSCQRS
jgi:hypothetical protein